MSWVQEMPNYFLLFRSRCFCWLFILMQKQNESVSDRRGQDQNESHRAPGFFDAIPIRFAAALGLSDADIKQTHEQSKQSLVILVSAL